MNPVIGILGGMGPRATVQFEQMLLDRFAGTDQQLPVMVTINDGTIPDRSQFVLGIGPDPVPRMQMNLRSLERLGASVVCIPCNTACTPVIFDRLTSAAPIINLPDEVEKVIVAQRVDSVCILATQGTIASGVYQDVCERAGVKWSVPDMFTQKLVGDCIRLVKQNKLGQAREQARAIARFVRTSGAEAVILGCTELPLLPAIVPASCQSIDTLEVLADACMTYVTQGALHDTRPIYA